MQLLLKSFLLLTLLLFSCETYAHGDLHKRIAKVSKEIKSFPDSAYLYLKRGVLYYQHEEFNKALADLNKCKQMDYKSTHLDMQFSKVYWKLKEYDQAISSLNLVLSIEPKHVIAYRLKGKVYTEAGNYEKAVKQFEQVLLFAREPMVENHLEYAHALEYYGVDGLKKAIDAIDAGLIQCGDLVVLLEKMVALQLKQGDYEKALEFQTKIINQSKRKEFVLASRAGIYLQQGNKTAAYKDLKQVLNSIDRLPPRIQRHEAIIELRRETIDQINKFYQTN